MSFDLLKNFDSSVKDISDGLGSVVCDRDVKFGDKLDYLLRSQSGLLPLLLDNLGEGRELDKAKADHVIKINSLICSLQNSLYKRRESDVKEEVDISHPKIQKSLEWFMELVVESLREVGVGDSYINSFITVVSKNMVGFEDVVNKRLRGLSFDDISNVSNPVIANFNAGRGVKS